MLFKIIFCKTILVQDKLLSIFQRKLRFSILLEIFFENCFVQRGPEKFQETSHQYDIILTVEEKVYDQVSRGKYILEKSLTLLFVHYSNVF